MKNRFLILMMAGLLVFLPGCGLIGDAIEYAADKVNEVIEDSMDEDDEDDEDFDDEDEEEEEEDDDEDGKEIYDENE